MRKYRPSNGTEGMMFAESFCDQCMHQCPDPRANKNCDIAMRTFIHEIDEKEYPLEWQYDATGHPTCVAFVNWNWEQDDDGEWILPTPTEPDFDPNQLMLFSITDDILNPEEIHHEKHA